MNSQCRLGLVLVAMTLGLSACVSVGTRPADQPGTTQRGVYHKVQKGETFWRIAKAYQVDIDDIVRSNNIPNVARIEENQLIFIPRAERVVPIPKEASSVSPEAAGDEFGWPLRGQIAHHFGERRSCFSRGIGIEAAEGQPVKASRQGKVVFADYLSGYAYTVILDHFDGYHSVYSLNSRLLVKLGDTVAKGEQIALTGQKGNSTFLYFEIRRNSRVENPLYYLPRL